jgi:hypothetical protein
VLAGCGQVEAPKAPIGAAPAAATPAGPQLLPPGVVEPAAAKDTPAEQPAAKPASPASLIEALRVIDLRKFPLPDGGKDVYKSTEVPKGDSGKDVRRSAAELGFVLRKGSGAQAAQFCRTQLAEAGWKVADGPDSDEDYFTFTGSKQGFLLTGGVYVHRDTAELSVRITNHGNIDSRTVPRFPGAELSAAELKYNDAGTTNYKTDAKPEAVLEFVRAEMQKGGWREVKQPGWRKEKLDRYARFIQRGIEIRIGVRDKGDDLKEGKIAVMNTASLLVVELPIMPEAKGEVEYLPYDYFHLFYAVPTGPEKVLEFYRNELPAFGWTMRAGTDRIVNGKAKVMLDSLDKNSLRLELLATKDDTLVLIVNAPKEKPVAPKPAVVIEKELRFEGKLAIDSPEVMGKPAQIHQMKMSSDKTYLIDMESKDFDAYLRILDSSGKQLASDDDGGNGRNARLRFTPPEEGNYQVVATRFSSGQGNYVLKIRVLGAGQEKQP